MTPRGQITSAGVLDFDARPRKGPQQAEVNVLRILGLNITATGVGEALGVGAMPSNQGHKTSMATAASPITVAKYRVQLLNLLGSTTTN
ncbi:hypothetical protein MY11210_005489 [Beauveria gryllotalpidicola]